MGFQLGRGFAREYLVPADTRPSDSPHLDIDRGRRSFGLMDHSGLPGRFNRKTMFASAVFQVGAAADGLVNSAAVAAPSFAPDPT